MSQNIEISALTQRYMALQADNAGLLQRWLDKMNLTAEEMNEDFENEAAKKGDDAGKTKGKEKEKEKEGDFRAGGKV